MTEPNGERPQSPQPDEEQAPQPLARSEAKDKQLPRRATPRVLTMRTIEDVEQEGPSDEELAEEGERAMRKGLAEEEELRGPSDAELQIQAELRERGIESESALRDEIGDIASDYENFFLRKTIELHVRGNPQLIKKEKTRKHLGLMTKSTTTYYEIESSTVSDEDGEENPGNPFKFSYHIVEENGKQKKYIVDKYTQPLGKPEVESDEPEDEQPQLEVSLQDGAISSVAISGVKNPWIGRWIGGIDLDYTEDIKGIEERADANFSYLSPENLPFSLDAFFAREAFRGSDVKLSLDVGDIEGGMQLRSHVYDPTLFAKAKHDYNSRYSIGPIQYGVDARKLEKMKPGEYYHYTTYAYDPIKGGFIFDKDDSVEREFLAKSLYNEVERDRLNEEKEKIEDVSDIRIGEIANKLDVLEKKLKHTEAAENLIISPEVYTNLLKKMLSLVPAKEE